MFRTPQLNIGYMRTESGKMLLVLHLIYIYIRTRDTDPEISPLLDCQTAVNLNSVLTFILSSLKIMQETDNQSGYNSACYHFGVPCPINTFGKIDTSASVHSVKNDLYLMV